MSARTFALVTEIVAKLAAAHVALAEPLDAQWKAIDLITTAADKICNVVSIKGEATSSEAKGDVKAQLSGLASKVADVGISAGGSITSEEYQSVLRQDLAATLKDNAACKLKVFEDLKDKLFPEATPVPTPVPTPTPTPSPTPRTERQAGVSRHAGMDAPGNDRGSWIRDVGSVDDCESICIADPGCAGYTYNTKRSTCIPKNRIGSLIHHNEEPVTGVILGRAGGSSGLNVTRYPNVDAPGNDSRWVRGIISVEQCEDLYLAESNCAGYTYNITRHICIPKTSIGSLLPSRDSAVTGVVNVRSR